MSYIFIMIGAGVRKNLAVADLNANYLPVFFVANESTKVVMTNMTLYLS